MEEAEDRDEMSIEEQVEVEKKSGRRSFEKEVERLTMQLMEKEDGLQRRKAKRLKFKSALGKLLADQEQMDRRTNRSERGRQKLRETSGKLRDYGSFGRKRGEMEELGKENGDD